MLDSVLFNLQNPKDSMIPMCIRVELSTKEQLEKIASDLDTNVSFLIRLIFKSFIDEYESRT
jgi:predicted DNA-binding protein